MTPTINHCTQNCLFCWRYQGFTQQVIENPDDPEYILEEAIKAQRRLITGFKGDPRCDQKKWREANEPRHVACSLTGEPTLYPRLDEFFEACHKRGMTTFLVTNGTNPEVLRELDPLPTQLYISVVAPNESIYKRLCRPAISDGWKRLQETLEILPSLDTRTVIRHTLVDGWNMKEKYIKQYARLDEKASPMFIEPKAYMFVGYSRKRLSIDNMPSCNAVRDFSKKLATELGYFFADERSDSRVVLLSKREKVEKIGK